MFENNSEKAKADAKNTKKDKPKMETVITNTEVKKSLKNKFREAFTNDDKQTILEWVTMEVIVPKLKEALISSVNGGLNMLLYGDPGRSSSGRTNYSSTSRIVTPSSRPRDYSHPRKPDISEVAFNSRQDAVRVLDALDRRIEEYDCTTIADFYEAVGIEPGHSDYRYGWLDLSRARIEEYRGQYTIEFPKPRLIE